MKKIIIFLSALIFTGIPLSAQESKYEKEINLVVGIGANTPSGCSFQGVFRGRFNDYVSLGLGMNLDYYYVDGIVPTHVPAYLSLKMKMNEAKVAPYIVLDAGYLLDCLSARRKFYFSPSAGINIATRGKLKINLGLGIATYRIEYQSGQRLDEDIFLIKLGFVF